MAARFTPPPRSGSEDSPCPIVATSPNLAAGLLAGGSAWSSPARAEPGRLAKDYSTPEHAMPPEWETMRGLDQHAAMLLYPGFTALDLVGP